MTGELGVLIAALGYFTRLPVPSSIGRSPQQLEQSARYLPLVGLIVGGIGALVTVGAARVVPVSIAILAGMAATLLLTGALHEDGLADAVDGFGGGMQRERVLEIMKDPRVGSFGAIAIGLMLLSKFNALVQIEQLLGWRSLALALIAGHALSRLGAVALMSSLDYARQDDSARSRPLARPLPAPGLAVAVLTGVAPCLLLPGARALVGLGLAAATTALAGVYFVRRIGGYTGDCLGATQQLAELAFYVGLLCVST